MRMKMKWTPSLFPKDDSGIRIRLFVYLCFRKDHCALDHHESAVRSWERTGLWLMGRDKLAQLKFLTASLSETIPVSFQMYLSIQMEDHTWHPRSWPWCSAGWASRCLSLSCVLRPAWGQKSAGIPEQSAWPAAAPRLAATSPAEADSRGWLWQRGEEHQAGLLTASLHRVRSKTTRDFALFVV